MARNIENELDQLRQLRDTGVLSDAEYRQAKAALQRGGAPPSRAREPGPRPRPAEGPESPAKRSGASDEPRARMKTKTRSLPKGLYRDGDQLVVREGVRFPGRCAICNKESDGEPVAFTFERAKTSHYIEVAAVQVVARAAVDLVKGNRYTGPVQAAIPLCSWHRGRRLRLLGYGVGALAPATAFLLFRYSVGGWREFDVFQISIYSVLAIVAALVGLTITAAALVDAPKLWFKATKFHDRFVWLKGAGRQFLRELPLLEDYHYKPGSDDPTLSADELTRRAGLDDED